MAIITKTYDSKISDLRAWRLEQRKKLDAARKAVEDAKDKMEEARDDEYNAGRDPEAGPNDSRKASIKFEIANLKYNMAKADLDKLEFITEWEENRMMVEATLNNCKEELKRL